MNVHQFANFKNKRIYMTGKTVRLVNFLLDSILFFLILIVFMSVFKNLIPIENMKWISAVLYFLYYFLFEYFKRQTIGKMITKSRVVSVSGSDKSFFIRIFFRTLMRFIPIDIISYLFTFRGFHDQISETSVMQLNENAKQ